MHEALIYRVFEPLSQGAPGSDAETLRALDLVPDRDGIRQVLDLGVGYGRTTLALAGALPVAGIIAIEIHAPLVAALTATLHKTGLASRVEAVCGTMERPGVNAASLDLVWAEGCIYVMGRARALTAWRRLLSPAGCIAFSDLAWWTDTPSREAHDFWATEYPDMASEERIRSDAHSAGFRVIDSFRLSGTAHDAYYAPLAERVAELAEHKDDAMEEILGTIRTEIDIARQFSNEAGYTFFVLERNEG